MQQRAYSDRSVSTFRTTKEGRTRYSIVFSSSVSRIKPAQRAETSGCVRHGDCLPVDILPKCRPLMVGRATSNFEPDEFCMVSRKVRHSDDSEAISSCRTSVPLMTRLQDFDFSSERGL